jgi:hypothetical protein
VSWNLNGSRLPTSTDWVALFRVGDPHTGTRQWWAYTGGTASGTKTLTAPSATGNYEFRLFARNSYTLLATSAPVTVGSGGTTPTPLTPIHNLKAGTEVYNYVNFPWGRYFDAAGNRWVQTFGMDVGACPLLDARRLVNNPQVAQDLDAAARRPAAAPVSARTSGGCSTCSPPGTWASS